MFISFPHPSPFAFKLRACLYFPVFLYFSLQHCFLNFFHPPVMIFPLSYFLLSSLRLLFSCTQILLNTLGFASYSSRLVLVPCRRLSPGFKNLPFSIVALSHCLCVSFSCILYPFREGSEVSLTFCRNCCFCSKRQM